MKSGYFLPVAAFAVLLTTTVTPVRAFECDNSGAAGTPDDHGDVTRTACGGNADAQNLATTAAGYSADAVGLYSTAVGAHAQTGDNRSVAVGASANAAGEFATAIGEGTTASGDASTAIGRAAYTTENYGTALGNAANAGQFGSAFGYFASASGNTGTALGASTGAVGTLSAAIGYNADALAFNSVALGANAQADRAHSIVLGSVPGVNDGSSFVDVGIGVTAPLAPLHVYRDDSTESFLFLESNADGVKDRAMMHLVNNGGIRFEFENPVLSTAWRFQAATGNNDRFEVTKVGTGEIEFSFRPNGDLVIAGNLFTNSDVNAKQGIVPVAGDAILDKLAALPVSEWSYRDTAGIRHLGPMAQDFHALFGLGQGATSIAPMDMAGVSLAAVKAVHQAQQRSQAVVDELRAELEAQRALVASLIEKLDGGGADETTP